MKKPQQRGAKHGMVAEEALRQSENKFRSYIESAPLAVFVADSKGNLVETNRAATELLGYDAAAFTSMTILELHPDEDRAIIRKDFATLVKEGRVEVERRFKRSDGRIIWGSLRVVMLEDQFSLGFCHDITARKQAEETLTKSEAALSTILKASPSAIGLVVDRVFLWVNERTLQMTGYSREELSGQSARILYASEAEFNRVWDVKYRQIINNGWGHLDTQWQRKDGSLMEVHLSSSAIDPANLSAGVVFTAMDITAHKQAEEALRLSERRRRLALYAAKAGTWEWDLRTNETYWSEELWTLLGLQPQSVQPSYVSWVQTIYPDDRPRVEAVVEKGVSQGSNIDTEWRVQRPDGSIDWLLSRGQPQLDDHGRVIRYLGIVMNNTERKRAEEALRESEAQYHLLVRQIPAVVYKGHADWSSDFFDNKVEALTGYSKEDFDSRKVKWSDLIFPEDFPGAAALFAEALVRDQAYSREYRIRKQNGEVCWVQDLGQIFCAADGTVAFTSGVLFDITDRKQTEAALQESEMFLKETQRIARLGGWKANPDTDSLKWTDGVYEIIGEPRDYSPGMEEGGKYFLPEYAPLILQRVEECLNTGNPFTVECQVKTTTGKILWTEMRGLRPWIEGDAANVVGTLQDITERKQAEAEILRQREELRGLTIRLGEVEEAERTQLAHELHDQVCQNLAVLGINLEVLKGKLPQEPVERLFSRVANLSGLVEQTGEITRNIMEGLRPTVLEHYGLMEGLRQFALQFFRHTGIVVDVREEASAPRLAAPVELALFRIAQEALANVAKHSRATKVTVCHKVQDNAFSLTIADNGVGFHQDRCPSPTAGHKWGLMTMAERALAVGGHCQVESTPGQGTRVVVEVKR
jgi:PAS domain S-box-containing protein